MIHLTIQQLSSYLDGQLSESSAEHTRQHLAECEECASKYAALEEQGTLLTRALTHDPGDAFFDPFASGVQDRIQSDAAAKAKPPTSLKPAAMAGKPAVSSKTDPVSDAPIVPRPEPASAKRTGSATVPPMRRAAPSGMTPVLTPAPRPARSFSWVAAIVVVMILGSVGLLVANAGKIISRVDSLTSRANDGNRAFGSDPLVPPEAGVAPAVPDSGWGSAGSPGQVAIAPNPNPATVPAQPLRAGMASGMAPTGMPAVPGASSTTPRAKANHQGVRTDDELSDGSDPQPVTESGSSLHVVGSLPSPSASEPVQDSSSMTSAGTADPFAALPPDEQPSVRTAQDAMNRAHSDPSANNYEAAASAWEQALDEMRGRPEQTVARQQVAEALYFAWQSSPNTDRADAAMRALRTYLVAAPPGLPREEAKFRLAQLNR